MCIRDRVKGTLEKLLISALPYDIDESCALAREHGGYVVPAHINKGANSMLANLSLIHILMCIRDSICIMLVLCICYIVAFYRGYGRQRLQRHIKGYDCEL